jgi:mannose-6-phosphate isomerase-like protein (cupin superfamily)
MKNHVLLGAALALSAVAFGEVGAQQTPPPPAPAPGSAGIFRAGADLTAVMQREISEGGAMQSSSIALTDQYRGSFVRRTEPNGAIVHPGNSELHYIVEGSGTVVTGGRVVRTEGQPARIEGGEAHRVVKGRHHHHSSGLTPHVQPGGPADHLPRVEVGCA